MKRFAVFTPDGSISGTVSVGRDNAGEMAAAGIWTVSEDAPYADEVCEAVLEDILRLVIAQDGA